MANPQVIRGLFSDVPPAPALDDSRGHKSGTFRRSDAGVPKAPPDLSVLLDPADGGVIDRLFDSSPPPAPIPLERLHAALPKAPALPREFVGGEVDLRAMARIASSGGPATLRPPPPPADVGRIDFNTVISRLTTPITPPTDIDGLSDLPPPAARSSRVPMLLAFAVVGVAAAVVALVATARTTPDPDAVRTALPVQVPRAAEPTVAEPAIEVPEALPVDVATTPPAAEPEPVPTVREHERATSAQVTRVHAQSERPTQPAAPEIADEPAPAAPPAVDRPEVPGREQVRASLEAVRPAVLECARGQARGVSVRVNVASSGRVTTAIVSGALVGTPAGSCVARAVRGARFPAFTQDHFVVDYPYQL